MIATRIRSTGIAVPSFRTDQAEIKAACARWFKNVPRIDALLEMFDRSGVNERYLAHPVPYYFEPHTFSRRNREYVAQGLDLGRRAIQAALDAGGLKARDIDRMYFVTTTGLSTPSLDAILASDMGFRADLQRNPLFGIGCAGGAAALGRAGEARGGKTLILSVELCGQTFRNGDLSITNLVAAALFGDGAAAVIVDPEGSGPKITASSSELFEGTRDVMGWEFQDDGFRLVLSSSVPAVVVEHVAPAVRRFLEHNRLKPAQVRHHLLHPGGARVLEAYEKALNVDVSWTRDSLKRVGNLSSASVLFVLHDFLRAGKPKSGDFGLLAAVGPGFALEASLLQWSA